MSFVFHCLRQKFFYRLNTKITVAIVLSLIAVLGASMVIIERKQKNDVLYKARELGSFISSIITRNLEHSMLINDRMAIAKYLEGLSQYEEIKSAAIIKENGQIAFSSNSKSIGMVINPLFISHLLSMDEKQSMNLGFKSGERTLSVMTRIQNRHECNRCHDKNKKSLGIMLVDISMRSTEETIANSRKRLIFSSVAAILTVSVLLFFLNNRYVYSPVRKLNKVIEGVKKGDLTVKENYPIKDEFGHLGDSLNTMVESLNEAGNKLRESYNKQLYQSEKLSAIGLLASGIIHEIQSPMSGIYVSLQIIRENIQDAEVRNVLDHILININKPMRMTRELLGFVRPTVPKTEIADINELTESVLFFVGKQAEQQKVSIIRAFAPDLPKTAFESDTLRQVFLNIMVNAMQAMPTGGNVTITTGIAEGGEYLFVSFEDTGLGIPSDQVGQLFKPFFTTKKTGTGLGLYISKGIIDALGGEIQVETRPEKGSKFTVKIPAKKTREGDAYEKGAEQDDHIRMRSLWTGMHQQ